MRIRRQVGYKHQYGGRHAEGYHVAQAVQFLAEIGFTVRQTRDIAVEHVKHNRHQDAGGRPLEFKPDARQDTGSPHVQVHGGHYACQYIDMHPPGLSGLFAYFGKEFHGNLARTVMPAFVLSPGAADTCVCGGR